MADPRPTGPLSADSDEPGEALRRRARCPCCEFSASDVLASEPYSSSALLAYFERHYEGRADTSLLAEADYTVVRCRRCSLAYQLMIPGDALLETVYERWITPARKDRLRSERDLDYYTYLAEQVQFLLRELGLKPSDVRAFDFGMGWGEWASMARAFGCRVAGAELSAHRSRHAESIGIEVIERDAIPGHKFEFINAEQVFEHLVSPLPVLRQLAAALEENGLIRISVPDSRSALRALSRRRRFSGLPERCVVPVAPLEHVNCFEYRSLRELGRRAGLELIRPSFRNLYDSSSGWMNLRNAARLSLRPVYRHVYPKSTIQYFRRRNA